MQVGDTWQGWISTAGIVQGTEPQILILTFLNLKPKQHRTHLVDWQKLGLKSLWVILSKGRVTGVDLPTGGPPLVIYKRQVPLCLGAPSATLQV